MNIIYCANPSCREPLSPDHVLLVTTRHTRHFCSVECIEPSRQAFERARNAGYRSGEGPTIFDIRITDTMKNQRP